MKRAKGQLNRKAGTPAYLRQLPAKVAFNRDISDGAKIVFNIVHSLIDNDKGYSWVKNETMSKWLGVSESIVGRRVAELIKAGLLRRKLIKRTVDGTTRTIRRELYVDRRVMNFNYAGKTSQPIALFELQGAVAFDIALSDSAKLYWGVIMQLSSSRGFSWVTNGQLAKWFGKSKQTVINVLTELIDNGYMKKVVVTAENISKVGRTNRLEHHLVLTNKAWGGNKYIPSNILAKLNSLDTPVEFKNGELQAELVENSELEQVEMKIEGARNERLSLSKGLTDVFNSAWSKFPSLKRQNHKKEARAALSNYWLRVYDARITSGEFVNVEDMIYKVENVVEAGVINYWKQYLVADNKSMVQHAGTWFINENWETNDVQIDWVNWTNVELIFNELDKLFVQGDVETGLMISLVADINVVRQKIATRPQMPLVDIFHL
ncbi:helix-turn-helix domain-containing protein [Periweissella cryptocerci]|uniref:Helix-turn-helix domain-containing protein n=1 Tax=Periweissella cryptocerci TaxID=2506420 RepID=A0A4P6YQX3_9LACO|nr:helix-turn-helix domain-containing protein [Periweissella cryptocerci]QBO35008.1 helix-turn-helix domain-containing protein [Periweissella cryptocerci]